MRSPMIIKAGRADRSFADRVRRAISLKLLFQRRVTEVNVEAGNGRSHTLVVKSNSDKNAVMQAFANSEFELPVGTAQRRLMTERARGPTLIIDAGANIGATCVQFALSYPDAVVVAVEPAAANFAQLLENTAGLANVVCLRAALSNEDGRPVLADLPDIGTNDSFRTIDAPEGRSEIRTISVASILKSYPTRRPLILKIDIEGYEAKVFDGDCAAIGAFDLIYLEPHDWMLPGERTTQSFIGFLASSARDFLIIGDKIASVRTVG